MRKLILFLVFLFQFELFSADTYFPPINNGDWETVSPQLLGWDISRIDSLYKFLEEKNSKAFILLKGGRIVLEKYFDSFTKDSIWYWASAGKTLTSALVGIAQEEGLLNIDNKTSEYLGQGWTSASKEKEDLITVRHQLTMTTGLDYEVEDLDCTSPECLKFKADAGSQWYYHNAPYTLLEKVVENAAGMNYNLYTAQKIRNKIGMNGAWLSTGYNNVYFSTPRSMARFGLMILDNGNWDGTEIIKDKEYIHEMINTSQDLNKSYGYLWWLNGKESFMIPGSSKVFNGAAMPDAPEEVFAALGKNGQILCLSPNNDLIFVRIGDRPDDQLFISTLFTNQIWQYLNEIMAGESSIPEAKYDFAVSPNPASEYIEINIERWSSSGEEDIRIYNTLGECLINEPIRPMTSSHRLNIDSLSSGVYYLIVGNYSEKFVVIR